MKVLQYIKTFIKKFTTAELIAFALTFIGGIILVVFWIRLSNSNIVFWSADIDFGKTGQVGDFIGGLVGSIWALVGVILFYRTLTLQRDALEMQREELALQREELRKTREVFNLQMFENTFFNMLKSHQEIKDGIEFNLHDVLCWHGTHPASKTEKLTIKGIDFFKEAKRDFTDWYWEFGGVSRGKRFKWIGEDALNDGVFIFDNEEESTPPIDEPEKRVAHKYDRFWRQYHNYLGHYFRHLHYTMKHIADGENKELERVRELYSKNVTELEREEMIVKDRFQYYAGVLRSHLSVSEQFLLYYNGLSFYDTAKPLIEKYQLVRSFTLDDLVDHERHNNLYKGITLKWMSEALRPDPKYKPQPIER